MWRQARFPGESVRVFITVYPGKPPHNQFRLYRVYTCKPCGRRFHPLTGEHPASATKDALRRGGSEAGPAPAKERPKDRPVDGSRERATRSRAGLPGSGSNGHQPVEREQRASAREREQRAPARGAGATGTSPWSGSNGRLPVERDSPGAGATASARRAGATGVARTTCGSPAPRPRPLPAPGECPWREPGVRSG